MKEGEVTPMVKLEEYVQRRAKYVSEMPSGAVSIFVSAETRLMSADIPYPYRQDSNFSYLCGVQEPECCLIVTADRGSMLFMRTRDETRERWDGSRTGSERAVDFFGVDTAYDIRELESILPDILSTSEVVMWSGGSGEVAETVRRSILTSKLPIINPRRILHQMRFVKSESEISLMKACSEFSGLAHLDSMRYARVGMSQNQLYSQFEHSCRVRGCQRLAYPPVVSSGIFNNTLHYVNNDAILDDGELVLIDGGGEYFNYASDITRTWPVNGKFTNAQKDLYFAVLNIQLACINALVPGTSLHHLQHIYLQTAQQQLEQLGISSHLQLLNSTFCPHMIGHYLGMDVHDVDSLPYSTPLPPNSIITIEPGIYIPHNFFPSPPLNAFNGIGIRIEDNFLVTPHSNICLTLHSPKDVHHIEQVMSS